MGKSLAEQVADLSPEDQAEALEGLDPAYLLHDWAFWGRPEQLISALDFSLLALVAGRGFGKTRTMAEWVRDKCTKSNRPVRVAVVGRTAADVRDVMVLGDSGICNIGPEDERPIYFPSKRLVQYANGSIATLYSAVEPDSIRGPAFDYAVCDEVAAWSHVRGVDGLTSFEQVQIATRLGDKPQIVVATTPKRTTVMKDLLAREDEPGFLLVRGSTYDNRSNLSATYIETLTHRFGDNKLLADQELLGLMVETENAMWNEELIERYRVTSAPPCPIRIISVDPTNSATPKDECGITAWGSTAERDINKRHAYLLEDASLQGTPQEWSAVVVAMAHKYQAPVVCEGSGAQALLAMAIHSVDPTIQVYLLQAKQGKQTRAEPVVLMYEAGRVHHVNYFPILESQLCTWDAEFTKKSPDRLDSAAWACISLLATPPKDFRMGQQGITASAKASRLQLPIPRRPDRFTGRSTGR
jgi:phage terminase large subunit-like protein